MDETQREVYTIAMLFTLGKKINEKMNKNVAVDKEKQDTIIFNAVMKSIESKEA